MTAFETIYEIFFDKARAYEIYELTENTANAILKGYLNTAIRKFKSCKTDLTIATEDGKRIEAFEADLSDDEIDILAEGMCYAFLKARRNNEDLFKNGLSTKDYTTFSPANLLNAVNNAYKECTKEFLSIMKDYSYEVNNVEDLKNDKR